VKHGKINATIPKDTKPEDVTMEQAIELIAARAAKAGKKPAAKKKAPAKKKTHGQENGREKAGKESSQRGMSGLPSDEALLEFLSNNPGQTGKREVARAFGIKGADRIALKQRLKALKDQGVITKDGNSFRRADALPPVFPAQVVSVDDDGDLIVVPRIQLDGEHDPDQFVLVEKKSTRRASSTQSPPGVGDVRCWCGWWTPPMARSLAGSISSRPLAAAMCAIMASCACPHAEAPISNRLSARPTCFSSKHDLGEAEDGDLVAAVRLPGRGRGRSPNGKVEEIFGQLGTERAISQIAVLRQGLPDVFPPDVLAHAESLAAAEKGSREDWRDLPLITIDPADAKDHDDAVHAAPDDDPNNEGGFVVTVAIADVAYYVRPHTLIDREARSRGNSVYFPDRVIPMLPERLSTDLCSLHEGEDRPALAIRMVFSKDGAKRKHSLHRVWIKLHAGLAYEAAQAAIDGTEPAEGIAPCPTDIAEHVLKPLWAAYRVVHQARERRAPLHLDLPERKLVLDDDGKVTGVRIPERLDAHKLIEEFMIQANVAAAELLEAKKTPCLYRVHDAPGAAKFEGLRAFLKSLNISIASQSSLKPADFNKILARAEGEPSEQLINEMVLRSQAQAEYTPDNIGHFGLNLSRYAHFTSPIRRYADLLVHRALLKAYGLGEADALAADHEVLARLGDHLSGTERRAMLAERETTDRLVAAFLADKVGARFDGRITGVVGAGLFVRLAETGADGFVPVSQLGADYFSFDEAHQRLVGSATGITFQLGDAVEVRLVEVAPLAGALRFEMLSEGKSGKPVTRGGRAGKGGQGSKGGRKVPGTARKRGQSPASHARKAVRKAKGR
jgi:ribonuclease R